MVYARMVDIGGWFFCPLKDFTTLSQNKAAAMAIPLIKCLLFLFLWQKQTALFEY